MTYPSVISTRKSSLLHTSQFREWLLLNMKKKHHDELERLERENKDLKQEVRLLNRRLKRLSKNQRDEEEEEPFADFEKKSFENELKDRCDSCKQGRIVTIDLGPRKQLGCNNCDWRGKITKK